MYSKTYWVDDQDPSIDAERLNKIEQGIWDAQDHTNYSENEPSTANPNGLKFVVLDEEPDVKYAGYMYLIKG